jgi:ABC-2 type transport system permease protein
VTSPRSGAQPAEWPEPSPEERAQDQATGEPRARLATLSRFASDTATIVDLEFRKLRHDPIDIVTRGVQPLLWLLIFGSVIDRARVVPTGDLPYLDFLAPGILSQSALFVSIFFGMAIIWERDVGVIHKLLVSPASRAALVAGKAFAAGVRVLPQAAVIYAVAALIGVDLRINALAILGVVVVVLLGSGIFATFSLIMACLVKTRERFMGIGQLMTMPLFFASNAIYPISLMPGWLRGVARANPLSYQVDAVRALMLDGQSSTFGFVTDFSVLAVTLVGLVLIAARLYPRVAL